MGRQQVMPDVAKFMSQHVGIMYTVQDVYSALGSRYVSNSVSGALVRLAAKPGTGVTNPTRGVYVYVPGSGNTVAESQGPKGKSQFYDRAFQGLGQLADGKVLIRDMETDLVYVGTLFESFR
jgi:hypothetical protein